MKYIVATSFRITARIETEAAYPSEAEERAETAVRNVVYREFKKAGVAFDSTEVNSEEDDDGA